MDHIPNGSTFNVGSELTGGLSHDQKTEEDPSLHKERGFLAGRRLLLDLLFNARKVGCKARREVGVDICLNYSSLSPTNTIMNHKRQLFLSITIMGTLALSASPAAANDSYGGSSGYGSSSSSGSGSSTGSSSTGSSHLALTGVDSSELALGGVVLAGTGAALAWGVRRKRLVA